MNITFAPLTEKDLEALHDWLNRAHVMRWWGKQPISLKQVQDKYKPRIASTIPCFGYIVDLDENYEKTGFCHWKTVSVENSGTEFILKLGRHMAREH
jgi:hypothetical protein